MYWSFTSLLLYILSYSVNHDAVVHDGGFCNMDHHKLGHFPLNPPQRHIPWIWDAVVSLKNKYVEATMVSRNACRFDQKMWKTIIVKFPQYSEQLGNGSDDNIYVPVDNDYDYVRSNSKLSGELGRGIQGYFVYCVYLSKGEEVARVRSRKILDVEIAELSTIQIRCPLPDESKKWDHMRIERILSSLPEERHLINSTEPFKVCADPSHDPPPQGQTESNVDRDSYKYKLSVCTATARSSRAHLVEWIEYHRLIGVEHFFIYDTNDWGVAEDNLLSYTLRDYIRSNIVTVVRWPYENCVKNMGSGRWVNVVIPSEKSNGTEQMNVFFQPPRAISQTAALASCFSRYKASSKWMAHMDDDEFLVGGPGCFCSILAVLYCALSIGCRRSTLVKNLIPSEPGIYGIWPISCQPKIQTSTHFISCPSALTTVLKQRLQEICLFTEDRAFFPAIGGGIRPGRSAAVHMVLHCKSHIVHNFATLDFVLFGKASL